MNSTISFVDTSKSSKLTKRVKMNDIVSPKDFPSKIKQGFEDPVMVLIVDRSGLTLYSYSFNLKKHFNEQLIGGYLTALYAFGNEVFTDASPTHEIMFHDYSVIMKLVGPVMFCYVFRGKSHSKNIDSFINRVRNYYILWHALIFSARNHQLMDTSELLLMNSLTQELFLS